MMKSQVSLNKFISELDLPQVGLFPATAKVVEYSPAIEVWLTYQGDAEHDGY